MGKSTKIKINIDFPRKMCFNMPRKIGKNGGDIDEIKFKFVFTGNG